MQIFNVVGLALLVLFCPKTTFIRKSVQTDLGFEVEMNDEDLAATETKNINGPYHLESLDTSPTNTAIGPKKMFP